MPAVDIIARLKLNAQEFGRGFKEGLADAAREAEKEGKRAGDGWAGGFSKGLQVLAAAGGVAAIAAVSKRALEYASNLKAVSAQAGVTAQSLQEYNYAAQQLGVNQKDLGEALTDLTKKIGDARAGNKQAGQAFQELGVDVTSAQGSMKATGQVMDELIERISSISDPTARARLEAGLFGDEWRKIDPLLSAGSDRVDGLKRAAEELGIVLSDDQIQRADETARKLEAVKSVLEARIASIVIENANAIYYMADAIGTVIDKTSRFLQSSRDAGTGFGQIWEREGLSTAMFTSFGALAARGQSERRAATFRSKLDQAELDYWAQPQRPTAAPPAPPSGGRGGGRSRGGRAANDNERAERERQRQAERVRDAEEAMAAALAKQQQTMDDNVRLAEIRAKYGDQAADRAEAELRIVRQFPELDGKRAGDAVEYHGVQIRITQAMLDQLAALRAMAGDEVDRVARAEKLQTLIASIQDTTNQQVQAALDRVGDDLHDLAYGFEDLFLGRIDNIWRQFRYEGAAALADLAADKAMDLLGKAGIDSDTLKKIAGNASYGVAAANLTGGSSLGGAAGGALGGAAAEELFSKALGNFAGPLGSVIGGVLGGLVGGLFKKTNFGAAVVTGGGADDVSVSGTNAGRSKQAGTLGNAVQQAIASIAEQFGVDANAFNVAIGTYNDNYRVSTTGSSKMGGYKGSATENEARYGLYDFGDDQAAAIAFAVLDAIRDGALDGLRESTKRLLANSDDLDANLSKALNFEQAFKDLKAITDPVGAALDTVNLKFKQLIATAKEAGASQEEMAQLEELYTYQREQALQAADALSSGLKSFLQSLKAGDSSPLSLREQEMNANAALEPFRQKILAGESVDTDEFQKAAQTSLSVAQQLYGSTQDFFDQYNLITDLTEKAISSIDARNASTGTDDNPFDAAIAKSSQATADILEQQSQQLAQQTAILEQIAAAARAGGGVFLGADRGFVRHA